MKKEILRTLIGAILLSLISGIVVSIIGIILGWNTSIQFSDGFFYAGAIMLAIGFLNVWGMKNQGFNAGRQYSAMVNSDRDEGFRLWMSDISRGYNTLIFLAISGLLLFGLSALAILFGSLF